MGSCLSTDSKPQGKVDAKEQDGTANKQVAAAAQNPAIPKPDATANAAQTATVDGAQPDETTAAAVPPEPTASAAAEVQQSAAEPAADRQGEASGAPPEGQDLDPKSESVKVALAGGPYVSNKYGPPRPAFQEERLKTVHDIKATSEGPNSDPNIVNILNLAVSLFGTESAVVTLVEENSFSVHSAAGALGPAAGAELPWLTGICGFSLAPASHEVLVIEDMAADARFNAEVRPGFDRFYCGAPLVAANGHRLGTMCLGGSQPKTLDAHQINVLCNMAEMIVRHVEKKWAEKLRRESIEAGLRRTISAYIAPFIFVSITDADDGTWDVIYANSRASGIIGVAMEPGDRKPFWELVSLAASSSSPWVQYKGAIKRGDRFTVICTIKAEDDSSQLWHLQFRPASKDALDAETTLVGVPSHVPFGDRESGNRLWMVELVLAPSVGNGSNASLGSTRSLASTVLTPNEVPEVFQGLELGPLLGKGSYGRVYRGTYHGEHVAVKIMDTDRVEMNEKGEPLEAVLTGAKHHPNLVSTIAWTVTSPPMPYPGEDPGKEAERIAQLPEDESQTWLILEYCDRPCLQDAIERGLFREGEARQTRGPDMALVCQAAYEISQGMSFLHTRNVVHGDLKGGNVLLKSKEGGGPRDFTAKVADFGLARQLGVEQRITSNKYGTITHCPPELVLHGTVSKAVDTYAFGVMLWELYHGTRAWAGLTHPQIMHAIGIAGTRLQFDRSEALPAHETYFQLAEACMAKDPEQRPSFDAMQLVLKESAAAWAKLKQGPGGGKLEGSLEDVPCNCVT